MIWRMTYGLLALFAIASATAVAVSERMLLLLDATVAADIENLPIGPVRGAYQQLAGFDPLSPRALAGLVRLDEQWLASGREIAGERILSDYRRLLQRRASAAPVHAGLAETKAHQRQFDDEFAEAIRQAYHHGPWETAVQMRLLITGLQYWLRLSPDVQRVVIQTAVNGMQHPSAYQRRLVLTQLERWGFREAICQQLPEKISPECHQKMSDTGV